MPSTTQYGLRYPATSDEVASGPTNFQNLADDVVSSFNAFGGGQGQNTSGATSGTTNRTIAEHTFTTRPAAMIALCLCMVRYTQSVATDEFILELVDPDTSTVLAERTLRSQAAGTEMMFGVASLNRNATRTLRFRIRRTAGTGTLTVTTNSDANRYAFIALPGAF